MNGHVVDFSLVSSLSKHVVQVIGLRHVVCIHGDVRRKRSIYYVRIYTMTDVLHQLD